MFISSSLKSSEYKSLTMLFSLLCRIFYLRHFLVKTKHSSDSVLSILCHSWCGVYPPPVLFFIVSVPWLLLRTSTPAAMQCMVGSRWVNINGKTWPHTDCRKTCILSFSYILALGHEGLYRLAAVKSHILAVKALYNKGTERMLHVLSCKLYCVLFEGNTVNLVRVQS